MLGIYSLESLLIVPHILRREWLICLVFRLVDDAWLLHDYRVPLTFRDLKSETAFTRVQIVASTLYALFVEEDLRQPTTDHKDRFRRCAVAVNRYNSSWQ